MARSYTHVTTAIWRDPEFLLLPFDAQWTYLMLLTQPDVSSCGLLTIAMRRWANQTTGMTGNRLSKAIRYLIDRLFIIVDLTTEELLIRTFVKWDGGYNNPKRIPAIREAAGHVGSEPIRAALATELDKLGFAHSLWDSLPDSLSPSQWHSPRVVVTNVTTSTNPQPTTHNPQPIPVETHRHNDALRTGAR